MTIDSLMRQTICPKEMELHLSLEDFPLGEKNLPKNLLHYINKGLKIYWHNENLKPHKKYIYAFRKHTNKCVVTVDDDHYYRKDMLERLWHLHHHFPECICANTVRRIPLDATLKYVQWSSVYDEGYIPSHRLIAIGFGGVLYPVQLFNRSCYEDVESMKKMSLSTDDLWLKANELVSDIKVVSGQYYCQSPSVVGSRGDALSNLNWREESHNDTNWLILRSKFTKIDELLYR